MIRVSQDMLSRVRSKLDPEDQRNVDVVLASSNHLVLQSPVTSPSSTSKCLELLEPFRRAGMSRNRYLGEISDVSFFNSVKALLRNELMTDGDRVPLESYEHEASEPLSSDVSSVEVLYVVCTPSFSSKANLTTETSMSDRAAAEKYVNIYFSTIHIAYPFIHRQLFMQDFEKYWDLEQRPALSTTLVALLCKELDTSPCAHGLIVE